MSKLVLFLCCLGRFVASGWLRIDCDNDFHRHNSLLFTRPFLGFWLYSWLFVGVVPRQDKNVDCVNKRERELI